MTRMITRILLLICAAIILTKVEQPTLPSASANSPAVDAMPVSAEPAPAAANLPIFRSPVVPGATISMYFDHNPANERVTFHSGRKNTAPAYGFYFSCTTPNMWDYVGCDENVSGEGACANRHELWYDEHHGTDYEFATNWHTGATCNPSRFNGITHAIYAPARGQVLMAGTDVNRPANGWHIRMKHDLNGNGNFDDDNFRSVYLHFTANQLAVTAGQIVPEGGYLGLGGSTGYSSSPHLHFEVQRSSDYFQTTYWPVDPFGWQGVGADPWGHSNIYMFRLPAPLKKVGWLPQLVRQVCSTCGERLKNGGFESGHSSWTEQGVQIIASVNDGNLPQSPYDGAWLGWLGGRDNANDILSQSFTIPSGAGAATFTYYLNITTTEGAGVFDTMDVNLYGPNGELLRQLDGVDNTFSPTGRWVERSVTISNLGDWDGQTVVLSFESATDSNNKTSFYIDSVSWMITGP